MEEFSGKIGFDRQTASSEKGEDLTVDGKPGPAQHKGGQFQSAAAVTRTQAADAAGELQQTGEQPFPPERVQPSRSEQSGQCGKKTGESEQVNGNRKEENEGADIQCGTQGVFDGVREGGGKVRRRDPNGGYIHAAAGRPGFVETEKKTDAK